MIGRIAFVLGDCFSSVKRGVRYAHSGDEVKVVAVSQPVAIVENSKGYRFPIGIKFLSFEKPVTAEPEPVTVYSPVKRKAVKRVQAKRSAPSANTGQQSLF